METHDTTFTVTYTPNKYKVTFMGSVGQIKECTMNYDYGTIPACASPTKAATEDSAYTFDHWEPAITMVTEAVTYRAQFTAIPLKQTIVIYYGEGENEHIQIILSATATEEEIAAAVDSVLKRRDYYPPKKTSTVDSTFAFNNWTYAPDPVTGLLTYRPQFKGSLRKYTITFNGYNNKPVHTADVAYGTTPTYDGATPTKPESNFYTYSFKGWTPDFVAVTGTATYTAKFDSTAKTRIVVIKYNGNDKDTIQVTVRLLDNDETINQKVDSALAARSIVPSKTATAEYIYKFTKWQTKEDILTGELAYVALFDSTKVKYEIKFVAL